ncbi:hypothetical protein H6P81_000010 [Aristolochia fimbriata]|uniref:Uncharacterized protein n=1 Tax=Aristolochia fimbriata TaxID=158543 RepID=A0AAV7F673_ARIFI|nr:hypothetical protein H6P81_000010 [Aristolochia fimbriata]
MNGAKRSAEAVGCKKCIGRGAFRLRGKHPREQGRVRRGRENASSQCPSTRRYGAEVTHAIPQEKLERPSTKGVPVPETDTGLREVVRPRMGLTPAQCRKVKEVGDLMTGEPATEAPVNGGRNYNGPKVAKFLVGCGLPAPGQKDPMKLYCSPGIGFGPFLRSLGGRRRRPPLRGGPTGQGTVSGRQFLWGVGLPKGNGGVQRFPRAGRRLALECKGRRELDCKTHPSSRDESRP